MTETQGKNPHEITNALKHSKPVIEAFANKKIKEMTVIVQFEDTEQLLMMRFSGEELNG